MFTKEPRQIIEQDDGKYTHRAHTTLNDVNAKHTATIGLTGPNFANRIGD